MTITDLAQRFATPGRRRALARIVQHGDATVAGLAGSSTAMMLASLPTTAEPIVVVGDSLDDAGYLYHDLGRIVGYDAVAMLPSAYKRDIKYGQIDAPNQVLRTETLRALAGDTGLRYVVTYPDALAERVAPKAAIDSGTINVAVGDSPGMEALCDSLLAKGFARVDYV